MPRRAATTLAWRACIGLVAVTAALAAAEPGWSQTMADRVVAPPQSDPQSDQQVVDVRVVGNRRTPLERILPYIRTRAGRRFDRFVIEEDVRRLNSSGLFVTVRASQQQVPGGQIVVFEVVERPTLEYVKYVGNYALAKQTLAKEADLKPGDPLDTFAVENARRRLEEFYHSKGFAKARVTVLEGTQPNDRGAVFLINEGPKQRILWTDFVGNTIASDAKLRSKIQSKQGILWIFKGQLDPEQLERDRQRLVDYYRSLGFFRARVGQPIVRFGEDRTWARITFVIDEGPRYQVRAVRFLGNHVFPADALQKELKLTAGQYFNQADLRADLATLRDKYGSIGYIFADIEAEPRFLEQEQGLIDLVYTVDEGQQYRVGRVEVDIKGDNPHTRISTVLNRLSLHPGQIVDIRELRASERRLRSSGLFEVNPANGIAPKIALSPPDPDEWARGIARKPRKPPFSQAEKSSGNRQVVYRPPYDGAQPQAASSVTAPNGTSSPVQQAVYTGANQPDDGNTGWVNLRVTGRLRPQEPAPPQPVPPSDGTQPVQQPGTVPGQPAPQEQLPPRYQPPVEEEPVVIRGQYTPESGTSMPPLYGSDSWYVPPQLSESAVRESSAANSLVQGAAEPWPGAQGGRTTTPGSSNGANRSAWPPGQGTAPVNAPAPGGGQWMPTSQAPEVGRQTQQTAGPTSRQPFAGTGASRATVAGPPAVRSTSSQAASVPMQAPMSAPSGSVPQPAGSSSAAGSGWSGSAAAPGMAPVQFPATAPPPGQLPAAMSGPAPPSQARPENMAPLLDAPPDQESLPFVPLYPQVHEARTGRFMISAGINSDAGLLGSIIIDEQNFDWRRLPRSWHDIWDGTAWRGAGQRFRVEAVPGTVVQRYSVTFQEPYLFDTNVGLGLNGYFYNRRYWEWDEERLGGRISFGYQFTHDLSGTFAIRAMNITVYEPISAPGVIPELDEVLGDSDLYGFRVQLTHDTRDNAFLPTEGHLIEMGFEQVIGSFDYPRADIDVRRYFLLREHPDRTGRHVLSLGARAFYTGTNTPIYEHFFAGGYSSLRGFEFRGATPVDAATRSVHIGGEFMLLASAEYMFSLTADDMIRAVVFCDTGTVEPRIDKWSNRYRVSPGFGFRITVPAMGPAPIALDFAFPISKEDTDEEQVFSFFVGFLR